MFNHEELQVYFRDKIVPFKDANISISNTGFLYGLAVFTGMRAHYNKDHQALYIFRPDEHYRRFCFSCRLLRYQKFLEKYDYEKFLSLLVELITVNKVEQDTYIRVTNFSDENKVTPKLIGYSDSLCMFLYPLGDYVPTTGMRCKVSSWTRAEDNAMPASGKINGLYVNTAFAKTEALMGGYDEALFLNGRGNVVEGSAENLFIVRDGVLITPPASDNILEGITRKSVMEIAADLGVKVVERSIGRSELYKADEVFLTGTGAKVSPVVEIDDRKIASGAVGPLSKQIQDIYFRVIVGLEEKYRHWLVKI